MTTTSVLYTQDQIVEIRPDATEEEQFRTLMQLSIGTDDYRDYMFSLPEEEFRTWTGVLEEGKEYTTNTVVLATPMSAELLDAGATPFKVHYNRIVLQDAIAEVTGMYEFLQLSRQATLAVTPQDAIDSFLHSMNISVAFCEVELDYPDFETAIANHEETISFILKPRTLSKLLTGEPIHGTVTTDPGEGMLV